MNSGELLKVTRRHSGNICGVRSRPPKAFPPLKLFVSIAETWRLMRCGGGVIATRGF